MDPLSAFLITAGAVILFAGWIQLLITAFKGDYTWGLTALFLPPLAYLYACFSASNAKDTLALSGTGIALLILGVS